MENIFSDDDDEYEALRQQLYEGEADEKEKLVPMFGLYTLVKTNSEEKPREDLFLRALEPPSSNDLDPYKDGYFEHKKPIFVKPSVCDNFSFFGMNQNKVKMESSTFSLENHIAEREKLLERMRKMEEEEAKIDSDEKENAFTKPKTPIRKPKVDTPRPALRKRSRKIVLSSDEDSNSDEEWCSSPRKKRVSPSD